MKVGKNRDSKLYQSDFTLRVLGGKKTFWNSHITKRSQQVVSFQSHCQTEKQRLRPPHAGKRMIKEVWSICNKMKISASKIVGLVVMLLKKRLIYFQKILMYN